MIFEKSTFKKKISDLLVNKLSSDPASASDELYYKATAMMVRDLMMEKRSKFVAESNSKGEKQVHYMSMEFLMGRTLKNSLYNLEIIKPVTEALAELGVKMENLYACEPDAGLGNGGLGRLAACYLDALATDGYLATGYSILYEYGIFKQKIIDGWQTELPDYWLPGGDVWLVPRPEESVEVHFGGEIEERWDNNYHMLQHKNFYVVKAVPYDMFVSGYDTKGVSLLRLWSAKSPGIDMDSFNRGDYVSAFSHNSVAEAISKILYPNDNHLEGKLLRLRQQYFLVCASVGDMVHRHMQLYGTLDNFPEKNAIHINDTHPVLAIPELMRILLDECGYGWDAAWEIVTKTFAYTNHTVMSEALEKWNEDMFRSLLPRIYQIIYEINERCCKELREYYHLDFEAIAQMAVLANHQVRMANLAVFGSHSVNGVSKLHSQIIKDDVFHDFYQITPEKFTNVTNGIASRRWLYQSNPRLTNELKGLIGDSFLRDMSHLKKLEQYQDDHTVHQRLAQIKYDNKVDFAQYIYKKTGQKIDPASIFDTQVKRLHEYKRQHLNALHILSLYQQLKENPNMDFTPKTFLFGAKAAPGYYLAKQIIKFICSLSDLIEKDKVIREKLRIVYLEDYNVTLSELLMPASEISEQISTAGTEASGTGNMKLMLNGAITLGTLDGANVEIGDAVGKDNILIFGLTTEQVNRVKQKGYNPQKLYEQNPQIKLAIDQLATDIDGNSFVDIANSLRYSDPYLALADFDSYAAIQLEASKRYRDVDVWQKMALLNIANSGVFCADRAIEEYAQNIWKLK